MFPQDETVKRNRRFYEDEEDEYADEVPATANADISSAAGGEYFFTPYEYKIVSSEENYVKVSFLRDLLVPYLEIYAIVGKELLSLPAGNDNVASIDHRDFRNNLLSKICDLLPVEQYGKY
jgi:hypothetical protein